MTEPREFRELRELRDLALEVGLGAASLLRDGLTRTDLAVGTKTTGTDMVTEMDQASERYIVDRLHEARPDDAILGEEGADLTGTSGIRWVVDPLDGTTNYLYGHPGCNVSIAAELDGRTIVGVVIDILTDERFDAYAGGGARRNGDELCLGAPARLDRALVATGFAYDPVRRRAQAELLARVIGQIRDIRRVGAAAIDLCSVALGRVDAFYERGLAPWDHLAGGLVAREAGAAITDLDGGEASEAFLIAAAPGLHDELRSLLVSQGAGELP